MNMEQYFGTARYQERQDILGMVRIDMLRKEKPRYGEEVPDEAIFAKERNDPDIFLTDTPESRLQDGDVLRIMFMSDE